MLHLSEALGAFLAGLLFSGTRDREELEQRLHVLRELGTAVANLQKSAGAGGVIAKIGGVKLQKSAGIFAIMSATLSGFGKEFRNALGKSL
jgi:hypothetical protein